MKKIILTALMISGIVIPFHFASADDAVDESKLFTDDNTVVDDSKFRKTDLDPDVEPVRKVRGLRRAYPARHQAPSTTG